VKECLKWQWCEHDHHADVSVASANTSTKKTEQVSDFCVLAKKNRYCFDAVPNTGMQCAAESSTVQSFFFFFCFVLLETVKTKYSFALLLSKSCDS